MVKESKAALADDKKWIGFNKTHGKAAPHKGKLKPKKKGVNPFAEAAKKRLKKG